MNDIQEVNTPSFMDNDDVILMNNRLMSDLEKIEHFNNKNNIKNSDHSTKKHTEQLLYQVMRENSTLREKNEKLEEEMARLKEDNSKVNEINDIRIKMTTIQHELNKQIEMNENLKSDNILLNNLIESMKKDQDILYHEKEDLIITNKQFEQTLLMKIENEKKLLADNQFLDQLVQKLNNPETQLNPPDCQKCLNYEYLQEQLHTYIRLYGKLSERSSHHDTSDRCSSFDEDLLDEKGRNNLSGRNKLKNQRQFHSKENEAQENPMKSHSDYSSTECLASKEYTTVNSNVDTTKYCGAEYIKQKESLLETKLTNRSDVTQNSHLSCSDKGLLSKLNDENKELRSMISEMNSYWQERQKKLEDRCRVLSARLKIERSSHRSSHYKSSSWIRSSMNILIPSKLKYNNKREMKRSQNEITSLNTTTNTINQHDSDTVERDGNDNNTNSNNNNTNHANEGIIDHSKADSQTDDSEISLTSLSEMESEYGQVAQESKLINNSKTRPMKSKEHGIQLLQLNNTISQLSEIQSSYNMLNQRNNSLIQQYQAMRTGKLKAEQLNKDLNNLIESLSNALRRSKRQNLQSKCIIESLKKYFYEIIETIKQFNEDGGNPTKVTDAPNKDIIPVDGNATKKFLKEFSHQIHQQLQEALINKKSESVALKTKLTIHENEAKRRRKCIEELRLRLQDIHQDKINLRNDLMKKEKLIENLKLTEINLQNTIESQRTQVKTLISEKKQISQNFSHLKEAHNHVVHELDELKESFLSLKLKQQVNTNQTDGVMKQTKTFTRLCANDRTEHLEKLILYLANELIRIIKLAYQLCIDSSATTTMATTTTTTTTTKTTERDTNRPTKKYTSPDGNSSLVISEDSLKTAKLKAAEILCLSLDDLEKLTLLENDAMGVDNHNGNNDYAAVESDDVDCVYSSSGIPYDNDTVTREKKEFSIKSIDSLLHKLSQWPVQCEKLLKDFPFSQKLKEEFSKRFEDLLEILTFMLSKKDNCY